MSIVVFAKKFRGFEEISIDITGATFLVGDNSSGKTSILHLVSYVFESDLNGIPALNTTLNIGRYDFFSPFFENGDVTIGFLNTKTKFSKTITMKKKDKLAAPTVTMFTVTKKNKRISVKSASKNAYIKVGEFFPEGDCVSVGEVISLHSEGNGFTRVEKPEKLFQANDVMEIFGEVYSRYGKDTIDVFLNLGRETLPVIRHSGPIRGVPESYYRFDRVFKASGVHFASMWHDMKLEHAREIDDAVQKFGRESKLYEEIRIEPISKQFEESPLSVIVKKNGKKLSLNQVGIGVSQVLPIIIESLFNLLEGPKSVLLLQQPELHLHPIAQAALGEFIFEMTSRGLTYVIETHSDFLIDRFRALMNERGLEDTVTVRIGFCQNSSDGNNISYISVNRQGKILNPPENFKEFFVNETIRTMM